MNFQMLFHNNNSNNNLLFISRLKNRIIITTYTLQYRGKEIPTLRNVSKNIFSKQIR